MKVMDSRSGLGAERRHSGGYGEHLQQRHGCEGALSCFDISGLGYQSQGDSQIDLPGKVNGHWCSPILHGCHWTSGISHVAKDKVCA